MKLRFGHALPSFQRGSTSVGRFSYISIFPRASILSAASKISPLHRLWSNAEIPARSGMEELILRVNFVGHRHLTSAGDQSDTPGGRRAGIFNRKSITLTDGCLPIACFQETHIDLATWPSARVTVTMP